MGPRPALTPSTPTVRIVGWNFLEGGLTAAVGQVRQRDAARWAAAQALMRRLAPDILVLNEALWCTENDGRFTNFGEEFGFPYSAADRYDAEWGNAILSRYPIVDVLHAGLGDADAGEPRGWSAARLATPGGPLWVATYHPHPQRQPRARVRDLEQLLANLNGPAIFVGDLNAIDPADGIALEALVAQFCLFQPPDRAAVSAGVYEEAGRLLFGSPDGVFPRLGWASAVVGPAPTIPTALIRRPGDPGFRIDHAWYNPQVGLRQAWVEQAPEADVASDHYPLVIELAVRT